jgi:hypothetical protein
MSQIQNISQGQNSNEDSRVDSSTNSDSNLTKNLLNKSEKAPRKVWCREKRVQCPNCGEHVICECGKSYPKCVCWEKKNTKCFCKQPCPHLNCKTCKHRWCWICGGQSLNKFHKSKLQFGDSLYCKRLYDFNCNMNKWGLHWTL